MATHPKDDPTIIEYRFMERYRSRQKAIDDKPKWAAAILNVPAYRGWGVCEFPYDEGNGWWALYAILRNRSKKS